MPDWVDTAVGDYSARMPRESPLLLTEVRAEPRTGGKSVEQMLEAERGRIESAIDAQCGAHARIVALDERGDDVTTRELARRLSAWQTEGDDVALLIGGPDGLSGALKQRAQERLRLSSLTLPHALARVVLAEALYRAASVLANHPYHRD